MAQLTVEQALSVAVKHHQAGQLDIAGNLYRQILIDHPDHPDAFHLLGLIAHQQGHNDIAVVMIRRAIGYRPAWADAYFNLGNALKEKGDLGEAVDAFQQAVALVPHHAGALNNLGNTLGKMNRLDEALVVFRQAISIKPDNFEAENNLGNVLREQGNLVDAILAFRQSVAISPKYAPGYSNLGGALRESGELDEAIAMFKKAISLAPGLAEAHRNLGNTLRDKGLLDETVTVLRRAIALRPGFAEVHSDLAAALIDQCKFKEAIACCRQAIALDSSVAAAHNTLGNALREEGQQDQSIDAFRAAIAARPQDAQGYSNLGNVLKECGQLTQAIIAYRQSIKLNPKDPTPGSNLLLALHYDPAFDAAALAAEHRTWNLQHAEPLAEYIQPHANDSNPERPLRVGYISSDFWNHVVGRNLLHLMQEHNSELFQIYFYAKVLRPDAMTDQFKTLAHTWHNVTGRTDKQVAELIRQDKIDILVDLSLHTGGNSLLVFARKPAPVQVSYLGYCGTTGLSVMDYRLSDRFLDPPETDLSLYSETTFFLEPTYWCYKPDKSAPAVAVLPAVKNKYITFGCLNNFSKVSGDAIDTWAQILQQVPNSKLLLHSRPGTHRQVTLDRFAAFHVDANRIEFVGVQSVADYLQTYNRIDIGLDPFPFAGGITSCDSLWMGVPIVTLAGKQSAVSRGGCSILQNVGLSEFIASDQSHYISIAVQTANDLPRLSHLRSILRNQMEKSPLMDAPQFTRNLEAAYRQMWHDWCKSVPNPS